MVMTLHDSHLDRQRLGVKHANDGKWKDGTGPRVVVG